MPIVQSHGTGVYYEVHGEGPALVFAHGGAGNTLSWFQQVPHFERSHKVIAFDLRGWGRSVCPPEQTSPLYAADDLLAILDVEGVEQAGLIGMSAGGWACLRTAVDHPERVACLLLIGSTGGIITSGMMADFSKRLSETAHQGHWPQQVLAPEFRKREPVLAFLHDRIEALNPPFDPIVIQGGLEVQVRPEELTGYQVPTLLVHGEFDPGQSPALRRELASIIPGLKTLEVKGSGPSPYFEAGEAFNRIVDEFVALHHRG